MRKEGLQFDCKGSNITLSKRENRLADVLVTLLSCCEDGDDFEGSTSRPSVELIANW